MALERIMVAPHPRVGNAVALWERNPEHPLNEYGEHEVYVAHGVGPVEVALTEEVNRRLAPSDGTLVRLDGPLLQQAQETHEQHLERVALAREEALAVARQEDTRRIRDASAETLALHSRVADLEAKLTLALELQSARQDAERQRAAADASVAQAEARTAALEQREQTVADGENKPAESAAAARDSEDPGAREPAQARAPATVTRPENAETRQPSNPSATAGDEPDEGTRAARPRR